MLRVFLHCNEGKKPAVDYPITEEEKQELIKKSKPLTNKEREEASFCEVKKVAYSEDCVCLDYKVYIHEIYKEDEEVVLGKYLIIYHGYGNYKGKSYDEGDIVKEPDLVEILKNFEKPSKDICKYLTLIKGLN